jgi:23S rRNA pseudouridine2605 synthase
MCGLGSRRSCDELIRAGRIYVNGVKVARLGTVVGPDDRVEYRGKRVAPVRMPQYFAYHKPRGVIVTARDPEGRRSVYDEIAEAAGESLHHLKYVGRLDKDSEGLLLFTNDGDLVYALTHPRYHVKKFYHVAVDSRFTPDEIAQATTAGVPSEEQVLRAQSIRELPPSGGQHWYEIVLREGKKRHIRRMLGGLSHTVVQLRRVRFGPVRLGTLAPGALRPLTEQEIEALRRVGYPRTKH